MATIEVYDWAEDPGARSDFPDPALTVYAEIARLRAMPFVPRQGGSR